MILYLKVIVLITKLWIFMELKCIKIQLICRKYIYNVVIKFLEKKILKKKKKKDTHNCGFN